MEKEELKDLIKKHEESQITEFKENLTDAKKIGNYISGLANSALQLHVPAAYFIWGIQDQTKKIVGTKFNPYRDKTSSKNQEPFITYIENGIKPRLKLDWDQIDFDSKKVIVLTIYVENVVEPIAFYGERYIRSGSSLKNLNGHPEKEREIWKSFEASKFELEFAKTDLTFEQVSNILDITFYAKICNIIILDKIKENLINSKVIVPISDDKFNITNLGAYKLAKNMDSFPNLKNRTIRITQYDTDHNFNSSFDAKGNIGIAVSFNNIVQNITNRLEYKENYSNNIRKDIPIFPKIAIRELVANMLVHQDFTLNGSRPFVEIYKSRIEFSNPGAPLINPYRFLDFKPKSRNDELANLLGDMHIVESRGTGIDKVVNALEEADLPAMEISVQESETTVVTLRKRKLFKDMTTSEKTNSIYWNACLNYVADKQIDNKSLRERFKLSKNGSTQISKAIIQAISSNLIKPYDPNSGRKFAKYIPFWGKDVNGD